MSEEQNLLSNDAFQVVKSSHSATVFPLNGNPYMGVFDNILNFYAWHAWHRHGWNADVFAYDPGNKQGYTQPEVKIMKIHEYPERVIPGYETSMSIFKYSGVFDSGFYQTVGGLLKGDKVTAFAEAHAWSNDKDGPEPHDGLYSEGPGYAAGYLLDNESPPYGTLDDWRNITFKVGIDPFGGADPLASAVVWGQGAHIYNKFEAVPTVETTCKSDDGIVTLFLRTIALWRFTHNDTYWQNATLLRSDGVPLPFAPYDREVWMVQQNENVETANKIFALGYPERRTIAYSAHDIANYRSDLTLSTNLVLWNVPYNDKDMWKEWFKEVAPIATVEYRYTEEQDELAKWREYLLWQQNPEWRDIQRAGIGCAGSTIGNDGCWDCLVASTMRIFEEDENATPVSVNDLVGPEGFTYDCQMKHSALPALGMEVIGTMVDRATVIRHLASGGLVFADVYGGEPKHFVLLVEYDDDKDDFIILDPWRNVVDWLSNQYPDGWDSCRMIRKYDTSPPVPEPGRSNRWGTHIQSLVQGVFEYMHDGKATYHKLVGGFEMCWDIWAQDPGAEVVCRHWVRGYDDVFNAPTPEAGAQVWWDKFSDTIIRIAERLKVEMPGKRIWVESMNEVYASFDPKVDRWIAIDTAFCELIHSLDLPISVVVYNAAVGNIHESEFKKLIAMARLCVKYGFAFGYHAYWFANSRESGLVNHWEWLAGRWQAMDKVFRDNGVYGLRWLLGEAGAVGGEFIPDNATFMDARLKAHRAGADVLSLGIPVLHNRDVKPDKIFIPRYDEKNTYESLVLPRDRHGVADMPSGGYVLLPNDGWRSDKCYGGDWSRFLPDIIEMNKRVRSYDPDSGCVAFTTGGWGWSSFEMGCSEWVDMAVELNE